jgi:transcription-repair coupling factor (superfamily II helicase)
MTIEGLFPLLSQSTQYRGLLDLLRPDQATGQVVLLDSALPYCVGGLRNELYIPILVLVPRPERARRVYEDLLMWCGEEAQVYQLPEGETLPFERLMADDATTHERIRTLAALLNLDVENHRPPPIIVTSLAAISQKTLAKDIFQASSHYVTVGQKVNLGDLLDRWQKMGYRVERAVEVPGVVSRRGGILDIYPPGAPFPARIELMGDLVESIRLFDPASQRSMKPVERVFILPAQEALPALLSQEDVERRYSQLDLSNCTSATKERIQEEMALLLTGHATEELGFYRGFFCQGTTMDFLPKEGLLVVERPGEMEEEGQSMDDKLRDLREATEKRGDVPENFPSLHLPWTELNEHLSSVPKRLYVSPWSTGGDIGKESPSREMGFLPHRSYWGHLDTLAKDVQNWQEHGDRVVLVSYHAARLTEVFQGQGISIKVALEAAAGLEEGFGTGSVAMIRGLLTEGWSLPLDNSTFHLLTDVEIMGQAKERPKRRRVAPQRSAFLSELEIGSYVVHAEHGIGRFAGTRRMETGDGEKEYLEMAYADGDKLYVPTDQLDRVSPYVTPGERAPVLTRLSTQEWSRSKARARASTRELAEQLLTLYASRETVQGVSFSPDTPWQQEMEDSFPYEETPDQLESIREVKMDMEASTPMDRLVCGDVGYGKTEVALRAAFKAVMDGLQVAVLVPTTVLAQQHSVTFSQRLAPFPVQVEVLSRFRTPEEQRQVMEKLALGQVDICIGTHRLLQKDVSFKNLGLVIVDEEQRFGVAHKERLKEMRKDADILTLSATPIPRTLHMALSGIRDMSTIETPPEERLSIKTYVSEYSDELVREAVLREIDRGGQVFFLHNRVRSIEATAEKIRNIVPEATVIVGHGQMPEETLEKVMADFAQGKSDVLVCTTIIEAGLDMPNANTLIIDRSDMLGLAQLYQLRGRVGRSANRAYAYLMVPRQGRITETAQKRLKTILAATELGAGFRIAMRDLEIRGAGNILGAEQSGHIHTIGYDLYSQMLAQAVEELKAQQDGSATDAALQPTEVKLDLPISAYIPTYYIPDLTTRLGVYQRLARPLRRDDIAPLGDEIRDRFGPLPKAVNELLYAVELKALAREAGAESISQNGKTTVIQLREPVGGARLVLQRAMGRATQVGHSQVRLTLSNNWRPELVKTLENLAAFKAQALGLSGTG